MKIKIQPKCRIVFKTPPPLKQVDGTVVHEVDVGGQVEGAEAAAEGEAGALGPIL
jgi:hypothetical protein